METKQYTVNEVLELQNQRNQLEQRLAVHRQRAEEKQKALTELLKELSVSSVEELELLCAKTNQEMQEYANFQAGVINEMRLHCDELDRML